MVLVLMIFEDKHRLHGYSFAPAFDWGIFAHYSKPPCLLVALAYLQNRQKNTFLRATSYCLLLIAFNAAQHVGLCSVYKIGSGAFDLRSRRVLFLGAARILRLADGKTKSVWWYFSNNAYTQTRKNSNEKLSLLLPRSHLCTMNSSFEMYCHLCFSVKHDP